MCSSHSHDEDLIEIFHVYTVLSLHTKKDRGKGPLESDLMSISRIPRQLAEC